MTSDPTPFERLIKLEHLVGELQAQLNPSTPSLQESAPPRAIFGLQTSCS